MVNHLASALLIAWIKSCALVYSVDPSFAQAVAIVESRAPGGGELEMRVGRLGRSKYWGPFGIHRDFLKKWPIDDPFVNIEVGVKALRGSNKRKVLKRYNASFDEDYYREVRRIERKLKEGSRCHGGG